MKIYMSVLITVAILITLDKIVFTLLGIYSNFKNPFSKNWDLWEYEMEFCEFIFLLIGLFQKRIEKHETDTETD